MRRIQAVGTNELLLPQWQRRAFEDGYHPRLLGDAHLLIDLLREQVRQLSGQADDGVVRLGMTRTMAAAYAFVRAKNGAIATHGAIFAALYGLRGNGEGPCAKIVDVWICKVRKRLPPDEVIENVPWVGYRWRKETAAAA